MTVTVIVGSLMYVVEGPETCRAMVTVTAVAKAYPEALAGGGGS